MAFGRIDENQIVYGEYTERFREHYRAAASVPWTDLASPSATAKPAAIACLLQFFELAGEATQGALPREYVIHPCTSEGLEKLYQASEGFMDSRNDRVLSECCQGWRERVGVAFFRPPIWVGDLGPETPERWRTMFAESLDLTYPDKAFSHLAASRGLLFVAAGVDRLFTSAIAYTIKTDCENFSNPFSWLLTAAGHGLVFIAYHEDKAVFGQLTR